jgi:membrane protein required for beta-lactamase induction
MSEHKHGEMDTTEQENTFEGFVTFTVRTTIAIIVVLIFLALVGA